jgi:hypothetical protein
MFLFLSIFILLLILFLLYKFKEETFYYISQFKENNDEDLLSNLTELNSVENVQLTDKERQQRQQDYQFFLKNKKIIESQNNDEDLLSNLTEYNSVENVQLTDKERQQRQQDYQHFLKEEKIKNNKSNRCDYCYKNSNSTDRINACNSYYKKEIGSAKHQECLSSNSKYAFQACTKIFGKGWGIFKKCN